MTLSVAVFTAALDLFFCKSYKTWQQLARPRPTDWQDACVPAQFVLTVRVVLVTGHNSRTRPLSTVYELRQCEYVYAHLRVALWLGHVICINSLFLHYAHTCFVIKSTTKRLLFNFLSYIHRRLADGNVNCAGSATYQMFQVTDPEPEP